VTALGALLTLAAAAAILFQMSDFLRARRRAGAVVPELPGTPGTALSSPGRHVVMFTSRSCAACRSQAAAVDDVRSRRGGIVLVDVADQESVARAFGVMGTPTAVVVQDRRIVSTHHGPQSVASLEALLTP
jgi:hypothetical protein